MSVRGLTVEGVAEYWGHEARRILLDRVCDAGDRSAVLREITRHVETTLKRGDSGLRPLSPRVAARSVAPAPTAAAGALDMSLTVAAGPSPSAAGGLQLLGGECARVRRRRLRARIDRVCCALQARGACMPFSLRASMRPSSMACCDTAASVSTTRLPLAPHSARGGGPVPPLR